MKTLALLSLPLVLSLAACGRGKQMGQVTYRGAPPYSAAQKAKDTRKLQTFCPNCHNPLDYGKEKCGNKACKELKIGWEPSYTCWSCDGSGRCQACVMREQRNGDCSNCKGTGILTFQGKTPDCPDCKGKKKCAVCDGSMKCDYCSDGKVSGDLIQKRAVRAGAEDDSDPKSDPPPPAAPPPAPAPAPEAPKEK